MEAWGYLCLLPVTQAAHASLQQLDRENLLLADKLHRTEEDVAQLSSRVSSLASQLSDQQQLLSELESAQALAKVLLRLWRRSRRAERQSQTDSSKLIMLAAELQVGCV